MPHRRLDQATFQALQALIARGHLRVSEDLARAIRERREEIGASVEALAQHFNVTADEIGEIEQGACEISAPTLVKLSQALQVDLVWFVERDPSFFSTTMSTKPFDVGGALLDAKEGLELFQAFAAIKDPEARKAVLELAQNFASEDRPDDSPPQRGDDQ